jgi:hypothetical protein
MVPVTRERLKVVKKVVPLIRPPGVAALIVGNFEPTANEERLH